MHYLTVHYNSYMQQTQCLLPNPGLLLVSAGADGRPNAMAIGWGMLGFIWGKPIFAVLVRPSRFSYRLLEESDSFTICVPSPNQRRLVSYCGTKSGRDVDKFAECGLEPLPSLCIPTPGIAGFPLIYECRIVHKNDVDPQTLARDIHTSAYPKGDYHRLYFGAIEAVRALTNACELLNY